MSGVIGQRDVRPYFAEQVRAAIESVELETGSEPVEYLVGLLTDFVMVPDTPSFDAPLASVLAWALEARPHELADRMRCLGDLALFRCGFFPDDLERRGVNERYAATLGGRAYDTVAMRRARDGALFAELARRFLDFARVLDEVRERTALQTPAELARMYTRYRATGSPRLARRLARHGVLSAARGDRSIH